MTLTATELSYLTARPHGRLATVAANGAPQNKPVGFRYNAELGTIDIYGFGMERSAKFRNVQARPQVSFLVDDVIGTDAEGVRFLEVRGRAETVSVAQAPTGHLSTWIIRIHPRRVVGWNIEAERPGFYARDLPAPRR